MNHLVGDPGVLTNRYNPDYVQFFRSGDVVRPSETFVFMDEHPDTLNDGFYMNRFNEVKWGNLPGSYHNGGSALSFTDGHTEYRRWVVSGTVRPPVQGGAADSSAMPSTDFDWLRERSSVLRQ